MLIKLFKIKLVVIFYMILLAKLNKAFNDDDVYITSEEDNIDHSYSHINKRSTKKDDLLKSYIDNLKENQEIVLSSGTGYSGGRRFKSGDIHIRKESSSLNSSPDLTESKKLKFSYPYGIGAFLMNGCYQYTGMPDEKKTSSSYNDYSQNDNTDTENYNSDDESSKRRKKRQLFRNQTNDLLSFCNRYAQLEKSKECSKIIPGAYTLGSGFDIKYENSESSRRKSLITRYCNYQKYFNSYSVPDVMTANGIYDTKTQTMSFGDSNDYMKFVAAKSNLDRYSNIFWNDAVNAYGGVLGMKLVTGSTDGSIELGYKDNKNKQNANKLNEMSEFWLFQITSNILIYELILDQINPWNIDPEFLVDFLFLPDSYFYEDAPEKFQNFIMRYGTHVIVSAKFGGEFKIMHTMKKNKKSSIEKFAEKCNRDVLIMFSRGARVEANIKLAEGDIQGSLKSNTSINYESAKDKEASNTKTSEYSSTYLSIKGGTQEVAAIVANMNQPDFSDSFIGWLKTVHSFPKAFDFKYESITSILSINVLSLFASTNDKERKICNEFAKQNCKFGFTIDEFQESWNKKLRALQFAISIYLKEPNGLTLTKFYIEKGNNECRFNILNYLSPYWSEVISGEQEFHITFSFSQDETRDFNTNEFYFKKNDEIYFMRRDDFWISRRKGDIYTYRSARLLTEPFNTIENKYYVNIFGLILEYNEKDATVKVANIKYALNKYSEKTNCLFDYDDKDNLTLRYLNNSNTSKAFQKDNNKMCSDLHRKILMKTKNIKNREKFWSKLWHKVIGVVDYVDPIKAVIRTWDLKFAVLPCQVKWSNNLMMVLPKNTDEDGKCLRFTAATEGELFIIIATTPSDQNTWYIFQITTKGVIFYREGFALLLNEDSAAGTTGDKNIYQDFFICLNYEKRKKENSQEFLTGLYIQYGIQIDSDETSHLYLNYFDSNPLDPVYYSFGSRNYDVQILNAHLEPFNTEEQIRLRCKISSTLNKAIKTTCDYKCNAACDGCTAPFLITGCKKCKYAAINTNYMNSTVNNIVCVEKCPNGYYPNVTNNNLCTDIDECATEAHECQKNSKCKNTIGSYRCICNEGYEGNGLFCNDIDECSRNTDNCSSKANCINTYGSFKCNCKPGFTGDGRYCTDINECISDLNDCSWNRDCINTIGSYHCTCKEGFQNIGKDCIDIDECLQSNGSICHNMNSICKNTHGSFKCICPNGYKMYNNSCHDINECHSSTHNCDIATQDCINTIGSFFCQCKSGLETYFKNDQNLICSDINECQNKKLNDSVCDIISSGCINKYLGYSCQCKEGFYKLNDKCYDINECHFKLHNCDSDSSCINEIGSFKCKCNDGFRMDESNNCIDIDECETGINICGLDQKCYNTLGSYICKCNTEIQLNLAKKCVESDGINLNCYLYNDIKVCNCEEGFELIDFKNLTDPSLDSQICLDIDECKKNSSICGPNSKCINQYGSYSCECLDGFRPKYSNNKFECEDFDECFTQCYNDCDLDSAYCINHIGSFECKCINGFIGEGKNKTCFDLDECKAELDKCDKNSDCLNTIGSYKCICKDGFYGNGTYCQDINECIDMRMIEECSYYNAFCINLFGSFECKCLNGYRNITIENKLLNSTSYSCIDIDECKENIHNCNNDSLCENTIGSYKCKCQNGYVWSILQNKCFDIDECNLDKNICDENSICVNTVGSYDCQCNQGWNKTSDLYCYDIDECKLGLHKCNEKSACYNKPGSYECKCIGGYKGDGFRCEDIDECTELLEEDRVCTENYYKCVNTIGSYKCECIDGLINSPEGVCIDINECEQFHPCNENSICFNTVGSYDCKCLKGFEQTSIFSKECFDIDECNDVTIEKTCHKYSKCLNTYGSYNCSCLNGFTGNGTYCVDIDECKLSLNPNLHLCNNTGKCVNKIGNYSCECLAGFERKNDSVICTDINECDYENCYSESIVNNDICYSFGLCRNLYGSFTCECFEGFEYDEKNRQCVDVNECDKIENNLKVKDICYDNAFRMATCTNICGNYSCQCKNTQNTIIDIYDSNKCYLRNEKRDFIFYIYNEKYSLNLLDRNINVTIESCNVNKKGNHDTFNFILKLTSFHKTLMEMSDKHFLPIYADNTKWSFIEFICEIKIDLLIISNNEFYFKDFKFILIEDPYRRRCSVYTQYLVNKNKIESIFTTIKFKLNKVWDILDFTMNCERSLKYVDKSDNVFTKLIHNDL